MTKRLPPLTCTGREFDRDGKPMPGKAGQPCGRTYPRKRRERQGRYELRARVDGWRIGPASDNPRHVMCSQCGRPDNATADEWRDLRRSVHR